MPFPESFLEPVLVGTLRPDFVLAQNYFCIDISFVDLTYEFPTASSLASSVEPRIANNHIWLSCLVHVYFSL